MLASFDTALVFAVLGPLFLLAGAWRLLGARHHAIQGRIWCTVGAILCVVALFLLLR